MEKSCKLRILFYLIHRRFNIWVVLKNTGTLKKARREVTSVHTPRCTGFMVRDKLPSVYLGQFQWVYPQSCVCPSIDIGILDYSKCYK